LPNVGVELSLERTKPISPGRREQKTEAGYLDRLRRWRGDRNEASFHNTNRRGSGGRSYRETDVVGDFPVRCGRLRQGGQPGVRRRARRNREIRQPSNRLHSRRQLNRQRRIAV